jgi:predicted XRE-type DNA-binding protein
MEGWIKLHRKILDNPISQKPLVFALFVYLILRANHKDKKIIWNGSEMLVKKGQLITGRKELAKQTGISQQSIRTAMMVLKSTSILTSKTTNKFSVITILNYGKYQQLTSTLTNNQPATNQQLTTNKNDKNVKNDKNIINNTQSVYGNNDINFLISYLKKELDLPKLDESEKVNRQYCYLLLKKFGGADKVKLLIDATAGHDFWSTRIASFKQLYYKAVSIISSTRDKRMEVTKV